MDALQGNGGVSTICSAMNSCCPRRAFGGMERNAPPRRANSWCISKPLSAPVRPSLGIIYRYIHNLVIAELVIRAGYPMLGNEKVPFPVIAPKKMTVHMF